MPPKRHSIDDLNPSDGLGLFTDGSAWAQDRSGGWAWLAYDAFDGECHQSGRVDDTTNNRMEMTAWIEGLNTLHKVYGPCEIVVFSDSQYVGFGAMDRNRNRQKNKDLWTALDQAIDQHKYVEFSHVRGHSGNGWNDMVDRLASAARRGITLVLS